MATEELLAQLRAYQRSSPLLLCTGHHQGKGASPVLQELLGSQVLGCDLTELAGLDNLQAPDGSLALAQQQAAQLWGAEASYFLVNGSTVGIQALILGSLRPGDQILLPRNIHRSIVGALILGNVTPIWLEPIWDSALGIAHGVELPELEQKLRTHPHIKAVLLVYPTYYGSSTDLAAQVALVHRYGIPLFVDSAHGSHFAFHDALPQCAVAAGADGVVQSTHKTGGAMTQSAMLHLQGRYVDHTRIVQTLRLLQTSSPSYVLLASLVAATQDLRQSGAERWAHTLDIAVAIREALDALPGCQVCGVPPGHRLDLTRITLQVPVNGFALEDFLIQEGVHPELAGLNYLLFILTPAHDLAILPRLLSALQRGLGALPTQGHPPYLPPPLPCLALDLPNAFFAPRRRVLLADSVDQVATQMLSLYPPGIPLVLPGEVFTPEIVAYITTVVAAGGMISGWLLPGWMEVAA
jgi:arginine decarboxylase